MTVAALPAALLGLGLFTPRALVPGGATAAHAGVYEIGLGFDITVGDYGEDTDSTIVYTPLFAAYTRGHWRVAGTIPFIGVNGPVNPGVGGQPPPPPPPPGGGAGPPPPPPPPPGQPADEGEENNVGIGDILLGVTYAFDWFYDRGLFLDLTGEVKFPTASRSDNLGTGEFDFLTRVDVIKLLGRWTPYATVGYRFVGKSDVFDLRNTFVSEAGFDYRITPRYSAGLAFNFRQSLSRGSEDPMELIMQFNAFVSESWMITTYGIAGFSDGSPAGGGGTSFVYRFWR